MFILGSYLKVHPIVEVESVMKALRKTPTGTPSPPASRQRAGHPQRHGARTTLSSHPSISKQWQVENVSKRMCTKSVVKCSTFADFLTQKKGSLTPEIQAAVQEVFRLQAEIVSRISHTEQGSVKRFYRQLREDFSKGIEQAYSTLVQA